MVKHFTNTWNEPNTLNTLKQKLAAIYNDAETNHSFVSIWPSIHSITPQRNFLSSFTVVPTAAATPTASVQGWNMEFGIQRVSPEAAAGAREDGHRNAWKLETHSSLTVPITPCACKCGCACVRACMRSPQDYETKIQWWQVDTLSVAPCDTLLGSFNPSMWGGETTKTQQQYEINNRLSLSSSACRLSRSTSHSLSHTHTQIYQHTH